MNDGLTINWHLHWVLSRKYVGRIFFPHISYSNLSTGLNRIWASIAPTHSNNSNIIFVLIVQVWLVLSIPIWGMNVRYRERTWSGFESDLKRRRSGPSSFVLHLSGCKDTTIFSDKKIREQFFFTFCIPFIYRWCISGVICSYLMIQLAGMKLPGRQHYE